MCDMDVMSGKQRDTSDVSLKWEKLLENLSLGQRAIYKAYANTLNMVSGGMEQKVSELDALTHLTGLLRFFLTTFRSFLTDTVMIFAREINAFSNPALSKATSKMLSALSPEIEDCFIFALSAKFDSATRDEIVGIVTESLNKAALLLPGDAQSEESFAAGFGARVLVTPQPAPSERLKEISLSQLRDFLWQKRGGGREMCDLLADIETLADAFVSATAGAPEEKPRVVSRDELKFGESASAVAQAPLKTTREETPTASEQTQPASEQTQPANEQTQPASEETRLASEQTSPARAPTLPVPLQSTPLLLGEKRPRETDLAFDTFIDFPLSQVVRYSRHSPSLAPCGDGDDDGVAADPSRWVFQLSNTLGGRRAEIAGAIRALGGAVDTSTGYSARATHLVAADGAAERTEKFLSNCAALRFIVPPRFVTDSAQRGRWIVGRLREYDMNPLRRGANAAVPARPFAAWRVVLFTSAQIVERGIAAVLSAGGCETYEGFVCGTDSARTTTCTESVLAGATHILVECRAQAQNEFFVAPRWLPQEVTAEAYRERLFTLELLYHVLCFCTTPLFDKEGRLIELAHVPRSCRIQIPIDTARKGEGRRSVI